MARFPSADVAAALADAARAQGVPLSLLYAVAFVESTFDPSKQGVPTASGERAQGLMQLMPKTQALYSVTDPYDARQSAMGAAKMLATLGRARSIMWDAGKMLAAYHWGPTAFARALAAGKAIPADVSRYVKRALAAQLFYRQQAPRASGQLVAALDAAIRKLAEDNPLHAPATELAANWAPFYAVSKDLADAHAVALPAMHTWWQAYKTVYERAPIDLGATDPSYVEPKFWLKVAQTVDKAVELGERAAVGLGSALFVLAMFVFIAADRRR